MFGILMKGFATIFIVSRTRWRVRLSMWAWPSMYVYIFIYISICLFTCLSSYQTFPENELHVSVIYNPNSQLKFQFGFRDFRVSGRRKEMAREMETKFIIWWLQMFTIDMPGPSNRDHEQRLHFRTITANPERCMVAPVCVLHASAMPYLPASVRTFASS